jgi:hypothetical protein
MITQMMMSREQLVEAAYDLTGGDVADRSLDQLYRLMTVTQFVTDLCLNEIERRGELTYDRDDRRVIIPYQSSYMLPTILRPNSDESNGITCHHRLPVAPVSVDDFELLVAQAFGFTARMLRVLPDEVRPDTTIAEMAAIFTNVPQHVHELAETEIKSWLQHMHDS